MHERPSPFIGRVRADPFFVRSRSISHGARSNCSELREYCSDNLLTVPRAMVSSFSAVPLANAQYLRIGMADERLGEEVPNVGISISCCPMYSHSSAVATGGAQPYLL